MLKYYFNPTKPVSKRKVYRILDICYIFEEFRENFKTGFINEHIIQMILDTFQSSQEISYSGKSQQKNL
jgi:hypothetical protein